MSSSEAPSCCASFWGPFRPVFGGHTLRDAASSRLIPTWLLFITRAAASIFMASSFVYYVVRNVYQMHFFSAWCHVGLAASFALTAAASFTYAIHPQPRWKKKSSSPAFFVILIFQIFASAALFLDVVFWLLLFDFGAEIDFPTVTQHAVNFALVLFDMLISLRMQFKLSYIGIFILYPLSFLGFAWIRYAITNDFMYNFLEFRGKPAWRVVVNYTGVTLWGVLAAFIVLLINRLNRLPCLPTDDDDDGDDKFDLEDDMKSTT